VVAELRKFALDLVRQMAQQMFFTPTRDAAKPTDSNAPQIGPNETYELRQFDSATMSLNFDLEQRQVVAWPINPQTTLETLFAGRTPEELKRFIRVLDLDDDFYKHLNLTVRAFGDFENTIERVEFEVVYEGLDENGQRDQKSTSLTFTDDKPQTWSVSLIGSERNYSWRSKVVYRGQDDATWSDWSPKTASPQVNIAARDSGVVQVSIDAFDVDFDQLVKEVQVIVQYGDPENGVPVEQETFQLTRSLRHEEYVRRVFRPLTGTTSYRTRFKLASDDVEEDVAWKDVKGGQIVVNQPMTNVLRVLLQPTGDGWDQVQKVIVELRYSDPTDAVEVQDTIELASSSESSTWVVHLRPGAPRTYEYRFTTILKAGGHRSTEWRSPDDAGSQVLEIPVPKEGVDITLYGDLLDLKATPATEVTVSYQLLGQSQSQTFLFNDNKPKVCHIPLPSGEKLSYTYTVTYNPPGQPPVTIGPGHTPESDNVLVIPAYRLVTPGTSVVAVYGAMVDYADTPLVAVDVSASTAAGATSTPSVNLSSDRKMVEVTVPTIDSHLDFSYRITYFRSDGTPQEGDWKKAIVPRVVVPRLATT
jgi:hypothetical protein